MAISDADRPRCAAVVYRRDTYRYTGRGSGGFSLHHTRARCGRVANRDGLCWQHERMQRDWGGHIERIA